jgi:GNAT superfamily N-acetyltransferase
MAHMSASLTDVPIAVRPFQDADRSGVLEILGAAFGHWPRALEHVAPHEFFRWKHEQSPFGRSILLVAEGGGAPMGFLALMPWRLSLQGEVQQTIRGVDIAVHPSAQRRGVSVALIAAARGCYDEQIALGWSNPNERSRRGVLRSGRRRVGLLPRYAGLGSPVWRAGRTGGRAQELSAGRRAERDIASVLADDALLARALTPGCGRRASIATARDPEFLRWRYGRWSAYRAVVAEDRSGRHGVAIFRVQRHGRFRVAHVCELLVERDTVSLARRLLRGVRGAAATDVVVCAMTSRRTAAACGLVRAPGGAMIAANPLRDDLRPDPTDPRSWALSLGDLELI